MSVKELSASFTPQKSEVIVNYNGKDLTFFANEIGYLESQNIAVQSNLNGKNGLAMLVAASITDGDGNKFTYEEVLRMKKEYAEAFFEAVAKLNGGEEKK